MRIKQVKVPVTSSVSIEREELTGTEWLKNKAFHGFRKKFAINTIKQLTTVQCCYTLFTDGREEPVTRSSENERSGRQATGISAGLAERKIYFMGRSKEYRVCGQENS